MIFDEMLYFEFGLTTWLNPQVIAAKTLKEAYTYAEKLAKDNDQKITSFWQVTKETYDNIVLGKYD